MIGLTQETYDETLEENQDLFELEDDAAVLETITQLESQYSSSLSSSNCASATNNGSAGDGPVHTEVKPTISMLEYHVCTAHPNSVEGSTRRQTRIQMKEWSDQLDAAVDTDGSVQVDSSNEDEIIKALEGVEQLIQKGYGSDEKESIDTPTKMSRRNVEIIQYLNLFSSNQTMYTLMSLLSVVTTNNNITTSTNQMNPTESQINVLQKVISVLITILSSSYTNYYKKQKTNLLQSLENEPQKDNADKKDVKIQLMNIIQSESQEKIIRNGMKHSFVAMERLVSLLHFFIQLELNDTGDTNSTSTSTLVQLIKLASSSCRNCEKNKVSFVRALKSCRKSDAATSSTSTSTTSNSTIGLLVNGLKLTLDRFEFVTKDEKGETGGGEKRYITIMTEFCKLISILCRFDDFGSNATPTNGGTDPNDSNYGGVSSMHDHVLEFSREGLIPLIHNVAVLSLNLWKDCQMDDCTQKQGMGQHKFEQDIANLAASALSATRVIAINDEIVQALVAVGALGTLRLALDMGVSSVSTADTAGIIDDSKNSEENESDIHDLSLPKQWLTAMSIGLARNLSGNDEIKTNLCLGTSTQDNSSSSLPSILPTLLLGMKLYRTNALIQEHACGALAAMALRKPMNALRIVQENGPQEILMAMKLFPNAVLVQRQGALAIRNIVSRLVDTSGDGGATTTATATNTTTDNTSDSIDVKNVFLDLGAEPILRSITGKHQGSVDEAYAALRDLGCEVSMVRYDAETNETSRKTVMFGDVKPNFRPVYK